MLVGARAARPGRSRRARAGGGALRRRSRRTGCTSHRDRGRSALDPCAAASAAYSPLGSITTARRPRARARSSCIFTTVLLPAPIEPATTTLGFDTSPAPYASKTSKTKVAPNCASPSPAPTSPVPASCAGKRRLMRSREVAQCVQALTSPARPEAARRTTRSVDRGRAPDEAHRRARRATGRHHRDGALRETVRAPTTKTATRSSERPLATSASRWLSRAKFLEVRAVRRKPAARAASSSLPTRCTARAATRCARAPGDHLDVEGDVVGRRDSEQLLEESSAVGHRGEVPNAIEPHEFARRFACR